MGNRRREGIETGRCAMVVFGEAIGSRAPATGGLRWGAIFNRLPPVARTLSPTATICHDLPPSDSLSRPLRRLAFRPRNRSQEGRVSRSLTALRLWRIDVPRRTAMRSDLVLEIDAEDLRETVAVCRLETEWLGCKDLSGEAGNEGIEEMETCDRRVRRGRRPVTNGCSATTRRPVGDNSTTEVGRTATFDDNRRQNPSLRKEAVGNVLASLGCRAFSGDALEIAVSQRLMALYCEKTAIVTHVHSLMGSAFKGPKGSETTTKNDNWRRDQRNAYPSAAFLEDLLSSGSARSETSAERGLVPNGVEDHWRAKPITIVIRPQKRRTRPCRGLQNRGTQALIPVSYPPSPFPHSQSPIPNPLFPIPYSLSLYPLSTYHQLLPTLVGALDGTLIWRRMVLSTSSDATGKGRSDDLVR